MGMQASTIGQASLQPEIPLIRIEKIEDSEYPDDFPLLDWVAMISPVIRWWYPTESSTTNPLILDLFISLDQKEKENQAQNSNLIWIKVVFI